MIGIILYGIGTAWSQHWIVWYWNSMESHIFNFLNSFLLVHVYIVMPQQTLGTVFVSACTVCNQRLMYIGNNVTRYEREMHLKS